MAKRQLVELVVAEAEPVAAADLAEATIGARGIGLTNLFSNLLTFS